MPEIVEVDVYRCQALATVARTIVDIRLQHDSYLSDRLGVPALRRWLAGSQIVGVRRIGKLLLLDVGRLPGSIDHDLTLGLRFGMTGRLVVDGHAEISELLYTTSSTDSRHEQFAMTFDGGGSLKIVDPRRFGRVEVDPNEDALGPDAATISAAGLGDALGDSRVALKTRMLDQGRMAGVGNLIADETLWRAGLSPLRQCSSLGGREVARLAAKLRTTIRTLSCRGGSHMGDLQQHRRAEGRCPIDATLLTRSVVGGRTTYWCPEHQV